MQNQTINKIVVTGSNYEKFLSDNVIDGKLDFSILVPIPDKYEESYEELIFKHLDNDELFLSFSMHENGFYFKPSNGFWKLKNNFDYPSFHYWAIDNWGPCINRPKVNLEYTDNGVVIRFLSYYSGPLAWSLKLKSAYPDLEFDCYSLSCRGVFGREYSENGDMRIFVNDYLKASDFANLDCTLMV